MPFEIPPRCRPCSAGACGLLALLPLAGLPRCWRADDALAFFHRLLWTLLLAALAATPDGTGAGPARLPAPNSPGARGDTGGAPDRPAALRRARVDLADGTHHSVELAGDEWQLDARVISGRRAPCNWGRSPCFASSACPALPRPGAGAGDATKRRGPGRGIPRPVAPETAFPAWLPFVDANYGSAAYPPLLDGASYRVTLAAAGGLVARLADALTAAEAAGRGLVRRWRRRQPLLVAECVGAIVVVAAVHRKAAVTGSTRTARSRRRCPVRTSGAGACNRAAAPPTPAPATADGRPATARGRAVARGTAVPCGRRGAGTTARAQQRAVFSQHPYHGRIAAGGDVGTGAGWGGRGRSLLQRDQRAARSGGQAGRGRGSGRAAWTQCATRPRRANPDDSAGSRAAAGPRSQGLCHTCACPCRPATASACFRPAAGPRPAPALRAAAMSRLVIVVERLGLGFVLSFRKWSRRSITSNRPLRVTTRGAGHQPPVPQLQVPGHRLLRLAAGRGPRPPRHPFGTHHQRPAPALALQPGRGGPEPEAGALPARCARIPTDFACCCTSARRTTRRCGTWPADLRTFPAPSCASNSSASGSGASRRSNPRACTPWTIRRRTPSPTRWISSPEAVAQAARA